MSNLLLGFRFGGCDSRYRRHRTSKEYSWRTRSTPLFELAYVRKPLSCDPARAYGPVSSLAERCPTPDSWVDERHVTTLAKVTPLPTVRGIHPCPVCAQGPIL